MNAVDDNFKVKEYFSQMELSTSLSFPVTILVPNHINTYKLRLTDWLVIPLTANAL